jgi:hypothetical protein
MIMCRRLFPRVWSWSSMQNVADVFVDEIIETFILKKMLSLVCRNPKWFMAAAVLFLVSTFTIHYRQYYHIKKKKKKSKLRVMSRKKRGK